MQNSDIRRFASVGQWQQIYSVPMNLTRDRGRMTVEILVNVQPRSGETTQPRAKQSEALGL